MYHNGQEVNFFDTRNTPKRKEEILNGGSVYWIVKGAIIMRQTIVDILTLEDEQSGKKFCRVIKSPEIMLVEHTPHRAMQGWRYFDAEKQPRDLHPFDPNGNAQQDQIDPQMAKDLAELGLL